LPSCSTNIQIPQALNSKKVSHNNNSPVRERDDRFNASVNTPASRGFLTTSQASDLLQQAQEVKNVAA
jgi:hypothetical protein